MCPACKMHPAVREIVDAIGKDNGLTFEEIMDRSTRRRAPAYCRFEAMAKARKLKDADGNQMFTTVTIGRMFSTDHTSVVHACKRHDDAVKALAAAKAMAATPAEVIRADACLKRAVAQQRLATYTKRMASAEEVRETPPQPSKDDRHVAAVMAQGGFCHYSEVVVGVERGTGARLMQISLPMVWPDRRLSQAA